MRVDGGVGVDLQTAGASAKETEEAGYDGAWSAETGHDPFLPLLLAAEHTEHLELGTGIAVAFARNPMNVASLANDLQAYVDVGVSWDLPLDYLPVVLDPADAANSPARVIEVCRRLKETSPVA